MIVGFGISDPKLGKYDTFLGVPTFLPTSVIGVMNGVIFILDWWQFENRYFIM